MSRKGARRYSRRRGSPPPPETGSGRFPLRLDELAVDQDLGDLHGVQRSALAEIIRDDPHAEAVFHRRVLADARNIGRVLAGRLVGRDVAAVLALVDDEAAGRLAEDVASLV